MKQRITREQLDELSRDERKPLTLWALERGYVIATAKENIPLLTIGQMIEYLEDHEKYMELGVTLQTGVSESGPEGETWIDGTDFSNLCNSLWEDVKEHLKTAGRL